MKGSILRGKLLQLLKEVYPDGMEQTTVIGIYYQHNKVDDIIAELSYLADKGYVMLTEMPHPFKRNAKVVYYKISPLGIDLCEGTIDADPGIVLQIEE